jgi:hypothetical protein
MVWFCPERETFLMLTVGSSNGRFALVRVSEQDTVVLESFQRSEDAIARLNELEGQLSKGTTA